MNDERLTRFEHEAIVGPLRAELDLWRRKDTTRAALIADVSRLSSDLQEARAERDRLAGERDDYKLGFENATTRAIAADNARATVERDLTEAREQLAQVRRELALQDRDLLRHAGHDDHACAQCIPGGPSLIDGFACGYHRALARDVARITLAAPTAQSAPAPQPSGEYRYDTSAKLVAIDGVPVPAAQPRAEERVSAERAQEAFDTLCETATCGVAPAATLQLYLMDAKARGVALAELERRARELCERLEAFRECYHLSLAMPREVGVARAHDALAELLTEGKS